VSITLAAITTVLSLDCAPNLVKSCDVNMPKIFVPVIAPILLWMMAAVNVYAQSGQCIGPCLVEVVGLQSTYSIGNQVAFSVQNMSKRDLNVDVRIEGMLSGSWRETMSSLTDRRDARSKARSPKIVPLMPIKSGSSLVLVFDPCKMTRADWPFSKNPCEAPQISVPDPASWRVRVVYVLADGTEAQVLRQEVRSQTFDFVAAPKVR
jgi:hypothetical protein